MRVNVIHPVFLSDQHLVAEYREVKMGPKALPGGFVDTGESCETAVVREMKEELSLDTEIVKLFGVYSEPDRDPRGHVVSVVYILKSDGVPVANDDAKAIKIIGLNDFEKFDFAFDHKKIIKDYVSSLI